MPDIYFISDTHFHHKGIMRHCPKTRAYDSVDEMNQAILDSWNSVVSDSDFVYHLGDFSFGGINKCEEVLQQLKGRKYLIRGNHDYNTKKERFHKYWEWIRDYYELKVQDLEAPNEKYQKIILCHYPLLTWNAAHHGVWHLHGHCHGNVNHLNENTTRLDVGYENFLGPISYEQVKEHMLKQQYEPVDHHGDGEYV